MKDNTMICRFSFTRFAITGLVAVLGMIASAGAALAMDYYKTAGNIAVYHGVMPAELVQGHSPEHPDGKMHGGVPSVQRQHHVVVAIFDTTDGSHIANAEVSARVEGIGLAPITRKLEPMSIANTTSFGNYFSMGSPGPYRIEIEIRCPNAAAAKVTFQYSHPRS
jgi:hypothetical protein